MTTRPGGCKGGSPVMEEEGDGLGMIKTIWRYPKWTNSELRFARKFLLRRPDLWELAEQIQVRRGTEFDKMKFWHHVRNYNKKIIRVPLKKLRASKGLNLTVFKQGLCPWNKGKNSQSDLRIAAVAEKIRQWSLWFWKNGPPSSVSSMRNQAVKNMIDGGADTRFKVGHVKGPGEEARIIESMRTRNKLGRDAISDKYIQARRVYRKIQKENRSINV